MLRVKVIGHAALLFHAAPEWHADEVALEVVCPLVVGAHELGRVAQVLLAELHTAVGAAVLDDVDAALFIARHHHRLVADEGALVVAGVGDFGLERDISPALAAKNTLLLALVDFRVGVGPVGHARNSALRPFVLVRRVLVCGKSRGIAHLILLLPIW